MRRRIQHTELCTCVDQWSCTMQIVRRVCVHTMRLYNAGPGSRRSTPTGTATRRTSSPADHGGLERLDAALGRIRRLWDQPEVKQWFQARLDLDAVDASMYRTLRAVRQVADSDPSVNGVAGVAARRRVDRQPLRRAGRRRRIRPPLGRAGRPPALVARAHRRRPRATAGAARRPGQLPRRPHRGVARRRCRRPDRPARPARRRSVASTSTMTADRP